MLLRTRKSSSSSRTQNQHEEEEEEVAGGGQRLGGGVGGKKKKKKKKKRRTAGGGAAVESAGGGAAAWRPSSLHPPPPPFSPLLLPPPRFSFFLAPLSHPASNLINLGGRKFGILGLAPLGSVPDVRGSYGGNSSNEINAVAQLFNYGLYYMLLDLNSSKFPEFNFSFGNTYSITTEMINNPASLGLSDVATACCGNQTLTGGIPCSPNATVCEFRHKFLFWDRHHPTEYGSQLAANDLFNGGSEFVSPFNLSTLVQTS
ncbi:GDSL esterase/lipase [Arachis hypogaea]|nr:GDSL esterase/lipase [Arachis hypogaea]